MKPHKHAEFIKAKADGHTIQLKTPNGDFIWSDMDKDDWDFKDRFIFRIKPAEPEKVYPVTSMTSEDFHKIYINAKDAHNALMTDTANAAIRRAIDDGQVVVTKDMWKTRDSDEWLEKTEWVQNSSSSFQFSTVGMHRADVMKREIEELRANRVKRDWTVAMAVRHYIRDFGIIHDDELNSILAGVK